MSRWLRTAGLVALVAATSLVPVATAAGPAGAATFPGRNGAIAFMRLEGSESAIWVTSPDGTVQTQLTEGSWWDSDPAVSPDGTKIAFTSDRSGVPQIYVMDADGTDVVRLTDHPAGAVMPAWSPDATKLAFVSNRDGTAQIYVMDADGTDVVRLTDDPGADTSPSWSPDGTRIAFTSDRGGPMGLSVMDADGTDATLLTTGVSGFGEPSWSPDGSKIAFGCIPDDQEEICTIDADGSHETRLTNNDVADVDGSPSWAPDGTKIVYSRIRVGDEGQMYVMNADGTGEVQITSMTAGDRTPSWGPGQSTTMAITVDSPDPSVEGFTYVVSGTVTVNPSGPETGDLPGQVFVTDETWTCTDDALAPTGAPDVYAFRCALGAGGSSTPGFRTITAAYSDPDLAYMPSTATEPHEVVAMPPSPSRVRISTPGAGSRATVVTWTPPPGPVPVGYQIRCVPGALAFNASPVSHPTIRWTGSVVSPVTVDGLTRGFTYHCMVRARYGPEYASEAGDWYEGPLSAWSNTVTVPLVAPPAPTGVRASAPVLPYPFTTFVSWSEVPNDTGAPITFTTRCTSTNGGVTRTVTGRSPRSIPNLSPTRRYTCTVTATNAKGSATSAPSNAVTALK